MSRASKGFKKVTASAAKKPPKLANKAPMANAAGAVPGAPAPAAASPLAMAANSAPSAGPMMAKGGRLGKDKIAMTTKPAAQNMAGTGMSNYRRGGKVAKMAGGGELPYIPPPPQNNPLAQATRDATVVNALRGAPMPVPNLGAGVLPMTQRAAAGLKEGGSAQKTHAVYGKLLHEGKTAGFKRGGYYR